MPHKNIYGHPIDDHCDAGPYDHYHEHYVHGLPNERIADDTTDQLPLFSAVGRGIAGDSYRVAIDSDSESATYLAGFKYDQTTKAWSREWVSENINGGRLRCTIQTYVEDTPPCFTLTFTYTREGRIEWEETTPRIPYIQGESVITIERLAKILSTSEASLQWLIDNKEANAGSDDDTGIHNTGNDLLDWIDIQDEGLKQAIADEAEYRDDADDALKSYIDQLITNIQNQLNEFTTVDEVNSLIANWILDNPSVFTKNVVEVHEDSQQYWWGNPIVNGYDLDWVALYDEFISMNMIKVSQDIDSFWVIGREQILTSHLPSLMKPAYGDIFIPVAHSVLLDDSKIPATVYLRCYENSEDSDYWILSLVAYTDEPGYDDGNYRTCETRLHNSILYYNAYNKQDTPETVSFDEARQTGNWTELKE